MGRGYFGIGIERPKMAMNLGTLWRSAVCSDADFIFTIGERFHKQASDTVQSWRHVPCWRFDSVDDWHIPFGCVPIGVEITDDAVPLETFVHPPRAVYLLGPEDGGLSDAALAQCAQVVKIDTRYCLNVATAGSIVMYDRQTKAYRETRSMRRLAGG